MEDKDLVKIYTGKLLKDTEKSYSCHNFYKKGYMVCGIIMERTNEFWIANTHDYIDIDDIEILYEYTGIILNKE